MEQHLEHEEIVTLMMEALDGQLDGAGKRRMEQHLSTCPDCAREWQALLAVHQLFLQSPLLSPAAGFTQRTLNRLPNSTQRLYFLSAVYGILLVSGLIPLALLIYVLAQYGAALRQPALVRSLVQVGVQVAQLAAAVVGGFLQALGDLGQVLGQQPMLAGWLLVMVGAVVLWVGVYGRLTRQPNQGRA